jgi:hypothetical protein
VTAECSLRPICFSPTRRAMRGYFCSSSLSSRLPLCLNDFFAKSHRSAADNWWEIQFPPLIPPILIRSPYLESSFCKWAGTVVPEQHPRHEASRLRARQPQEMSSSTTAARRVCKIHLGWDAVGHMPSPRPPRVERGPVPSVPEDYEQRATLLAH